VRASDGATRAYGDNTLIRSMSDIARMRRDRSLSHSLTEFTTASYKADDAEIRGCSVVHGEAVSGRVMVVFCR
jgi:hypothetical protein